MQGTTVTSKGQVTIPVAVRRRLGIRRGTVVAFRLVDDHVELHVADPSPAGVASGFGMLRTRRPPAPADLDPATLVER
jgi:AbrB family looped-hinge helix DNA binding protein